MIYITYIVINWFNILQVIYSKYKLKYYIVLSVI